MQRKCYFRCKRNGPLHSFPSPEYPHKERFEEWKSILDEDIRNRGNTFIHGNVRLCGRHFENKYKTRGNRLTANSVPTLNLSMEQEPMLALSILQTPTTSAEVPPQNVECLVDEEEIEHKDKYSVAYVTVPSTDVGKTIAHGLVKNNLAACVNIVPQVISIYEWKGEINEDSEALLMIKTRTSQVDRLTEFVRSNHPYEVCEVISLPIKNGNPPYLKWIGESVPEN